MIGRTNAVGGGAPNKSTIIVTAPTGSTVTCKSGSTTKTAAEKNGTWTFSGLDNGTWTITATKDGQTATENVVIEKLTVIYLTMAYRVTPAFTYSGDYEIVDDNDNVIDDFASWKGNWKILFLTSGALTFTNMHGFSGKIDVFLVGGGGGGSARSGSSNASAGAGAGGGGYTKKSGSPVSIATGTSYPIAIGAGGTGAVGASVNNIGKDGGVTSAFGLSANGGKRGCQYDKDENHGGGDGGSGGAAGVIGLLGGTDGSDGQSADSSSQQGGTGQGSTTREFGYSAGKLYSTGGNCVLSDAESGAANTGDGGDGVRNGASGAGGSGIVVIRNAREAV